MSVTASDGTTAATFGQHRVDSLRPGQHAEEAKREEEQRRNRQKRGVRDRPGEGGQVVIEGLSPGALDDGDVVPPREVTQARVVQTLLGQLGLRLRRLDFAPGPCSAPAATLELGAHAAHVPDSRPSKRRIAIERAARLVPRRMG